MSDQYVSRVALEVNGEEIDDFESVTEKKVELAKQVKLMGKTGFVQTVPRYQVAVDYVIPFGSGQEFDFTTVVNGTLTIDRQDGTRITFSGVVTMDIGDTKYNSEKEATKTITFGASARTTV